MDTLEHGEACGIDLDHYACWESESNRIRSLMGSGAYWECEHVWLVGSRS